MSTRPNLEIADRTLREARQSIAAKNAELAALEAAQQNTSALKPSQVRLPSRQTSTKKAAAPPTKAGSAQRRQNGPK
ncbi:MAG: hypothetical protein HC839_03650 [Leptolyngbyaceae cyanobacterium RM2_2_21]|nr:hypothetical protein [Leptolyngbyaceae cyanobacterium RM2_2_21]